MLIIIKFLKTNIKKCDLGLKEIPHSKNIQLGKINNVSFSKFQTVTWRLHYIKLMIYFIMLLPAFKLA